MKAPHSRKGWEDRSYHRQQREISPAQFARVVVWIVALLIIVRSIYLLSISWGFITDDAYISFRYARNFADGHGLVFNPGGERVEGFTNPLWVAMAAFWYGIGVDAVLPMRLISCGAMLGTWGLMYLITRRWTGPMLAVLPAYLLSADMGEIYWTVSGLETAWYQLMVVGTVWASIRVLELYREEEARWRGLQGTFAVWGFALFSLGAALTRAEGPVIGLLACLVIVLTLMHSAQFRWEMAWPKLKRFIGIVTVGFFVPYGLYFLARWGYFEKILPHTVSCKALFDGDPWKLLRDFWKVSQIYIVLALLVRPRKVGAAYFLIVAVPVFYGVILYGTDPIVGHFHRHFLAAYALILIGSAVGLSEVSSWILRKMDSSLREFLVLGLVISLVGFPTKLSDDLRRQTSRYAARMEARAQVADWLQEHLNDDDSYVIGDAGLIPFSVKGNALDGFCLNSVEAIGPDGRREPADYVTRLLRRQPAAIVVHSQSGEDLLPRSEYDFYPTLVEQADIEDNYILKARFGAPLDRYHYWIFLRERQELH